MARIAVADIIDSADLVKNTWIANPTFTMGDLKFEDFSALQNGVRDIDRTITEKRHELQGLLDRRDDQAKELKRLNSRALSGFRSIYGPDSPQYDQAGGVRISNRSTRRRGPAKPEAVAAV